MNLNREKKEMEVNVMCSRDIGYGLCSHGIGYGWDFCSRKAVVELRCSYYCKQHALMELPSILILPNVENKEELKASLIKAMFGKP